jgi:hypothetical protein
MKMLSAVLMVLVFPSAGYAAEAACYERIYDAGHMQKHALQEVTKMKLLLQEDVTGEISAGFKEIPDYLTSEVACRINGKTTACEVGENGGAFTFVPTIKGIKITNKTKIRFGGENDGVAIGNEAEHREFFLFKIACSS